MKMKHVTVAATMALLAVCVAGCIESDASNSSHPNEGNTEWVVGVSKDQPKADIETAGFEISKLITERARGGDWIHIVSLPDHLTVGSFIVPEGSERTRLRDPKVREVLPKLADAFRPSGETNARIDLPALTSTVGSIRRSDFPCRVVLFGSPIYRDPTKQGWNFDQGGAPLDESIGDPESPFVTTFPLPENCQVVVATPGPNWGEDKPHEDAVAHFWRRYIQSLGKSCDLVRLTDAPQTAFVFDPPQFTGEEPIKHPGFGMRRFAFNATRVKFDREGKAVPISGKAGDGAIGKSLDAVIRDGQADPTKIIVIAKWESIPRDADPKIDLDLRATVRNKAGEISYKNPVVDGLGRLYRDIQTTNTVDGSPIETWEGLELETTNLDAITLWVNCFAATAPSKIELIRIHRGEIKKREVTLKCSFGDGGQNEHHRARSDAWVQIAMEKFKATDSPGTL
ncbi:hypothetical protein [Rhodopirellula europaea]|uniref:hypothetical protein n=1 Tax=Rhodopirellula europaea TaxID=1263866 RepID=UPI003D2E27F1